MKKSLATLCALFLFVSIALAETSETQPAPASAPAPADTSTNVRANNFGYNMTGMLFSALGGVFDMPFYYQHSFGKVGLDLGFEYATNDLIGSDYYTASSTAIAISAGPTWFPAGKGVSGLFVRARASLIFATASYKGVSASATGFGADAHIGYNWVLPTMIPNLSMAITPFVGFQTSSSVTGFSWGVGIAYAF